MGLSNNTNKNKVYLTIVNGKVTRRLKGEEPGAEKRALKNGREVWEMRYDQVDGKIKGFEWESHDEYGEFINVMLEDNSGDAFQLQMPIRGGYAYGFFSRIPNVDFNKEVRLTPYLIDRSKEGKSDKAVLVIYQDDNLGNSTKVESFFTRENPNGLPELKQVEFQGQTRWDDTDRVAFFRAVMDKKIASKIKEANTDFTSMVDQAAEGAKDFLEDSGKFLEEQAKKADEGKTEVDPDTLVDDLPF